MRRVLPLSEQRTGTVRWSAGRKVRWYFGERFSPWLLEGVGALMQARRHQAALHLMLLGLEILSGFLEGRAPDEETFSAFADRYLGRAFGTAARGGRRPAAAAVLRRSFRRGFEDGCLAGPGVSIAERSRYACRLYSRVGLRVDIRAFHRAFVAACRRFADDAAGDYIIRQRFVRRFDQLVAAPRRRGRGGRGGGA
ncbi:MAG: hypothetical protein PHN82_00465 [bacterium]|nr:hypothetical protein [bacterium]